MGDNLNCVDMAPNRYPTMQSSFHVCVVTLKGIVLASCPADSTTDDLRVKAMYCGAGSNPITLFNDHLYVTRMPTFELRVRTGASETDASSMNSCEEVVMDVLMIRV